MYSLVYSLLGVVFVTLFKIIITEKCLTPNHQEAECVPIYSCQILMDALKTKQNEAIEFVRKSKCEGRESDRMVCCGSTSKFSAPMINKNADKDKLLPDRSYCGYQHSDDYFRNETATGINEFPWLAGLLYKYDKENRIRCSGTLINDRYVLTAAHCIITSDGIELVVGVRLGEYNIKTDEDCIEEKFYECSEPPQNFEIEKIIPHPQFNAKQRAHDIGLLRLSKKVHYSDYIRPICLPAAGTVLAKPGDIMYTSGWGLIQIHGEQADTKKKIACKLITNEECAATHPRLQVVNENHLCTLELEDNREFSCVGDDGAPVVFNATDQWHQEGISSFGVDCHEYPAAYTKVVNYLDWIKEHIEP